VTEVLHVVRVDLGVEPSLHLVDRVEGEWIPVGVIEEAALAVVGSSTGYVLAWSSRMTPFDIRQVGADHRIMATTGPDNPPEDAYQEYLARKRTAEAITQPPVHPTQPVRPSRRRMSRRAVIWLSVIGIVLLLFVIGKVATGRESHKAAAYCATTQVGHTTALNTEQALGSPDSKVTHQGTLYLAYGSVTFYYDDPDGYLDDAVLAGTQGC
jgi:hypothetical protein